MKSAPRLHTTRSLGWYIATFAIAAFVALVAALVLGTLAAAAGSKHDLLQACQLLSGDRGTSFFQQKCATYADIPSAITTEADIRNVEWWVCGMLLTVTLIAIAGTWLCARNRLKLLQFASSAPQIPQSPQYPDQYLDPVQKRNNDKDFFEMMRGYEEELGQKFIDDASHHASGGEETTSHDA